MCTLAKELNASYFELLELPFGTFKLQLKYVEEYKDAERRAHEEAGKGTKHKAPKSTKYR